MVNKLRNTGIGITPEATLIFFILHIFIALLTRNSSTFSTFYALVVFTIGVLAALGGKDFVVICVISYIVGAEVLWRMTKADVFWEFGKYAISGILILALLVRHKSVRPAGGLVLYFALLLPAILLTPYESWNQWRQVVSFNISGPLSLCLCGIYFSRWTIDKKDLQKMFVWLMAPVISITFLVWLGMVETSGISWSLHSSKIAAGNFGPNQVSSILGLAAFLSIVFYVLTKRSRFLRNTFLILSVWFFSHAILTFSRGGVVGAATSSLLFLLLLIKSKRNKLTVLFLGIFLVSLIYFYLIPKLDKYTGGMLRPRYAKTEVVEGIEIYDTSRRFELVLTDIQTFKNNLLFGVGVGNSREAHLDVAHMEAVAHTEWTRMLAEHGMLGAFSMFFLWLWILKRYRSMTEPISRAMALAFLAGFVLYTSHSAIRLVIPAFMAGLLGADFKLEERA